MDEVIVKYRVRVIFGSIFQRKENVSASKFTNCAMNCAMRVYLGKDSQSATDDMTATHATVRHLKFTC